MKRRRRKNPYGHIAPEIPQVSPNRPIDPNAPPDPLAGMIIKPPYSGLINRVPIERVKAGWTYRHVCMQSFYASRGLEKYYALQKVLLTTWPTKFLAGMKDDKFIVNANWNPWLERLLKGFCNEEYAIRTGDRVIRTIGLTGCAAASKSHCTALFAVAWWSIDPENSIAVLTSTTKDMIRSRVWSVIRDYATSAVDAQTGEPIELGHLVDSQMKLYPPSKNAKNSIAAYAVAHGETAKAVDNLKGLHAPRMLVVIDEANSTPEAIFNVLPNYTKGCKDLTVIVVGNPVSRLDSHGRALKPEAGWPLAMDENVIEWRTEGCRDWEYPPGLALRFDGRDSPNVQLKYNKHPYLYLYEDWLKAEEIKEKQGGNLAYWSQSRGMWPGEGMGNQIFSEQLFIRCNAIGSHFMFDAERESVAFCDLGFGGDSCIIQFGELGKTNGRMCLQLTDWIDIPIDPTLESHDVDYQLARWIQSTCITRKIKPNCVGLDSSGPGRGVSAILAAEWSPKIHCTFWGGGATERPSAQNDGRPGKEVYFNFVTEMWFATRELLEAEQIRGFSHEAISQFCARTYELRGKRYLAEPKSDMRLRLRYSPDCFVSGTLVETDRGEVPIEQIKVGDQVLTPFGFSPVLLTHRHEVDEVVEVTFDDGSKLCGTGKHPVLTQEGWTRMDAISCLHETSSVAEWWRWNLLKSLFTRVSSMEFSPMVDITSHTDKTCPNGYFIESSGLSGMGLFLRVLWFTIKTGTGLIIQRGTSLLCRIANTVECTLKRIKQRTFPVCWPLCLVLGRLPRLGTPVMQVSNGIDNTARKFGQRFHSSLSPVNAGSVGSISSVLPANHGDTARPYAKVVLESLDRQKVGFVSYVKTVFRLRRQPRQKRVRHVAAISTSGTSVAVHNLTLLRENAYYANGVLVRNCADAVVGLVEISRRLGMTIDGKITQAANKDWDRQTRVLDRFYEADPALSKAGEGGWAEEEVFSVGATHAYMD